MNLPWSLDIHELQPLVTDFGETQNASKIGQESFYCGMHTTGAISTPNIEDHSSKPGICDSLTPSHSSTSTQELPDDIYPQSRLCGPSTYVSSTSDVSHSKSWACSPHTRSVSPARRHVSSFHCNHPVLLVYRLLLSPTLPICASSIQM